MKKLFCLFSFLFCQLISFNLFAGTDPIGWSVSPSTGLPATTQVGSSYVATYTLSNNLPFAVPVTVSDAYTGGSFTFANGCNTTLAAKNQAGSSCIMHISFQPINAGVSTSQLTVAYHNNRIPLTMLSSTASSSQTADKINGHITTRLPPVSYTGTNYPVTFTFANNGTSSVTATSVSVSGFTPTSNTCTAALAPNTTCAVSGSITPTVTGFTTLSVTYNDSTGSVPLTTQTNVQNGSGACHHVDGFAALPLPVTTFQYADNVVQFQFTNECDTSTETLGTVNLSSNGTATLTKGTDTCSGATLAANASCSVYASVVPTDTAASLTVTAAIPYNGNTLTASTSTSEVVQVIPNQSTVHTVMFVNQCNQNVWYEFQNGSGGSGPNRKSPDPTPAGSNTFADYQLNAQLQGAAPTTKTLSVNDYVNGALYGRTGCDATTGICSTANCPVIAGTGTCQTGVGATNPTTIFELNMETATASDGVYDVSLINGFNIPGEVRSLAPVISPFSFTAACGQSAGALIQPTGSTLGACPWSFTPPSTTSPDTTVNYNWVSGGTQDGCTTSTSCGGLTCGMAYASTTSGTTPINRRCGTFLGYWTIDDFTGYTATSQWGAINLYTSYSLGTVLPNGPSGSYGNAPASPPNAPATFASLYGCVTTDNNSLLSGYGTGTPPSPLPNTNVCGCYDWNQTGSRAQTAQASQCTASNSDWTNTVFPRILWLKQACPTAYSFQFDDKSVSFTCNVTGQKTSYQVTYCPGGKTGSPGT